MYGGHTIGIAACDITRVLPELVTIVGWEGCDHTGPVHEGDTLHSTVTVTATDPLPGGGGLVGLRSIVRSGDPAAMPWTSWTGGSPGARLAVGARTQPIDVRAPLPPTRAAQTIPST